MDDNIDRKRLARSFHAELSARNYGRYLFLKKRDAIERLFLSFDMLVPEKDMERICGELLHDIFFSVGQCIRHNVEVRFCPKRKQSESLFEIKYTKRYGKRTSPETFFRARRNIKS